MPMRENDKKRAIARTAGRYARGEIGRRELLRTCGRLGLGFSAAAMMGLSGGRPWRGLANPAHAQAQMPDDIRAWLREVGGGFRGTTVRMASEATPPTRVIAQLARTEFTPLTGIEVQIELLPLEQVLQKLTLDVAAQTGQYDTYYMDQSWMARFSQDTVDPREKYEDDSELAMPNYAIDDFVPSLVQGISMYQDKMVGVPYDIPIFIMMYRKDIMDELGLAVPKTMDEYMTVVTSIQEAKRGEVFGTTGQLRSGHYSLNCDWTAWLWSHGGSIFNAAGEFTGGDERGMEGLAYMTRLRDNMPPGVDGWNWDGQGQSLRQGLAGVAISWGEFFPSFDDAESSRVVGMMEAAVPPAPKALRPPAECGFGEIPHIGHQGGSALGLSSYSQNQDAAWVFLQWATSADVQTRASLLGGGASPMRTSTFNDPRIKDAAKVGPGTTRHFPAVLQTIETMMGSEPDLVPWPEISNSIVPIELGRLFAGQHPSPEEAMTAIKGQTDALVAEFRE